MNSELICTPVMLPGDGPVSKDRDTGILSVRKMKSHVEGFHHHLYMTSEQEIKKGDWIYNWLNNDLTTAVSFPWIQLHLKHLKKVIATTDKSLSLPLIPSSFIEEYVTKQGEIDKAKLQRRENDPSKPLISMDSFELDYVIILPIEDKTFSREEVIDFMVMAIMNDNSSAPYTIEELKQEFPNKFNHKISDIKGWFNKHY